MVQQHYEYAETLYFNENVADFRLSDLQYSVYILYGCSMQHPA